MAVADKTIWTPGEDWELKDFGGVQVWNPKELLHRVGHNIGIYAKGGAGKTTAASSVKHCPHTNRVLHYNADGNAHVLAHDPSYKIVEVFDWSTVEKCIATCKALLAKGEDLPFNCIVWDNMSSLQDRNMLKYAKPGEEEIQHWRKNMNDILAMTRFFVDLSRVRPVSVIFLAWEAPVKNSAGAVLRTGMDFSDKLQRQWPGMVDSVAYLTVEDDGRTRKLSFNPHRTDAKLSVAHTEAAVQIPFDLYYHNEPVLTDIFNTIIDEVEFPSERYTKEWARSH